jgi:hypothetical protein
LKKTIYLTLIFLASLIWYFGTDSAIAKPTQLEVSTIDGLIQALGSNRTIHLKPGVYHLTQGLKSTQFVKWKSPDSPTLVLHNIKNLKITGSGAAQTKLVSSHCKGDLLDFEFTSSVSLQGIGFGRMLPGMNQDLDCEQGLRGDLLEAQTNFKPDPVKIANWQHLASDITRHKARGIELPEFTEALYPQILEQVRAQTQTIQPEQDPIKERFHAIRPRLGLEYSLKGQEIMGSTQKPAQAAAMVFDRSHNLLTVFDTQANVILALEGRNNTRQSWVYPSEWLMQKSMVMQSNAPAPNGIYAFGTLIKDNPKASFSFGSFRIVIEGGIVTKREILFHSRDHSQTQEIPWSQDINSESTRTLGCFLFQDPDLNLLAQLLLNADQPVALVVQGNYAKNLKSPLL